MSWLFLRPADDLEALEDAYLTELLRSTPAIAAKWELERSFFALVRERQPDQLDAWLTQARVSGVRELAAFAEGIRRDYAAVRASCELPWSQGQTEGHVNRLKLLKRQMFGRAKLDLLLCRLLGPSVA